MGRKRPIRDADAVSTPPRSYRPWNALETSQAREAASTLGQNTTNEQPMHPRDLAAPPLAAVSTDDKGAEGVRKGMVCASFKFGTNVP